ncbi:MAG: hypothetical protein GX860_04555 [Alcaligenaceae bacterium]|nr:hypothetical protein [Alcaligenaceae bacterium]
MSSALTFQKWFSRLIILFVIWNCVGLRYTVSTDVPSTQGSVSLFFKESPSLKLIYTEFK